MKTALRQGLLGGLVILQAAGCRESVSVESSGDLFLSRATPGASFEWSMPERFGMDRNGDGLTDYPRAPEDINPSSWTVNFDACGLPAGTQYIWHVDQRRVASVGSCQWTHDFVAEGRYDVALHVIRAREPSIWAEHVVTVQDWLIVSFGDSYASGEGVPEIPAANDDLLNAIDATMRSLQAARDHLNGVRTNLDHATSNLADAFEQKGLAESILTTQQQRLNAFLNACRIETFKDIVECAEFLAGLPFDTYQSASDHFHQAVSNAQERVESLTQAYLAAQAAFNEAQAAFNAAQEAIASLETTIAELRDGLGQAVWQAPFPNEDWENDDCHRSARAAPARAALALERSDPRTSVTFLHLACTGARIDQFRARLQSQVPWADELIGPREIDAVLVSIGGNDAGFADIATACVVQQPCYVDAPAFDPAAGNALCAFLGVIGIGQQCTDFFGIFPERSAKLIVEEGVGALPTKYALLANDLLPQLDGLLEPEPPFWVRDAERDPLERVRSNRVYITEYVDMTRDDDRAYCRAALDNLLGTVPGVSLDEMGWLDLVAAGSINQAVASAAAAHGWNAVGGIYRGYASHGYCADNHWVVRVHETLLLQGDPKGMAHPNNAGHTHNGQAIFAALMNDLYPDGVSGAPRAPDQPLSPGAASLAQTPR